MNTPMTHSILLLGCLLLGCLIAVPAAADDGLIAHWEMPNVDRAQPYPGVVHNAERAGLGLGFRGAGDYVDLGDAAALKPTGDMTISVWVRLQTQSFPTGNTNWTILDCERSQAQGFMFRVNGTDGRIMYRANQPGSEQLAWSDSALENDRACHVVFTQRGGEGLIYVNGIPSSAFKVKPCAGGDAPLTISSASQAFEGLIYEVALYKRALAEREVVTLFRRKQETYCSDAVSWRSPAADGAATAWQSLSRGMHLSRPPSGWVLTSSNADFTSMYSESAIDGDLNTAWRSFLPTTDQWIDLAWDFPMTVDRVSVLPHEGNELKEFELLAWQQDDWVSIAQHPSDGQPYTFSFDPLRTERVRLVMRSSTPGYASIREIAAYGPRQPMVTIDSSTHRWEYVRVDAEPTDQPAAPVTVTVESCEITPPHPKPGTNLHLKLKLRPQGPLPPDTPLVLTIGEREMDFKRSDYTVTREILRPTVAADGSITVDQMVYLPVHAPHGKIEVMLHAAPGNTMRLVDKNDGRIAQIDIRRFDRDPQPDETQHTIKLDNRNGAVITIDGEPTPPIMFALQCPSFKRFHHYSQAGGVKIYHLQIYPYRISAGIAMTHHDGTKWVNRVIDEDGDYKAHNYAFVAGHIRNLLRIDPDAYVIVQMDMRTSEGWRAKHPGSSLITHTGSEAHESFCAQSFRDEAESYVADLVRYVEKQPWQNRVVGYLVELAEPEGVLSGYEEGVGDYNPQAIAAFRQYLRGKYSSNEDLRRAYGDTSLTFETIYPTYADITANGDQEGCFLHPVRQRLAIDYHAFLSTLVPRVLSDHLAATIKRMTDRRILVGSYWGYMTHDLTFGGGFSHQMNHCDLPYILKSPNLDFFASPFSYSYPARHAGEPPRVFQTVGALRINGKLQIPECDHRTFRAGVTINGRNWSRADSVAVIRRDIGSALMHGSGAWLSDWTNNDKNDRRMTEPYFMDEQLLREVSQMRAAYQRTINEPRKQVAETAVLVSGPTHFYHDHNAGPIYSELVRKMLYTQIGNIGAPHHELVLEDLEKPKVQNDYKCYIFLNAFYLTAEQREIVESLKRDGKTLVWIYAPGYVTDTDLSVDHIESLTGFSTNAEFKTQPLTYQTSQSAHPILAGVESGSYGGSMGEVSPRFYVTDPKAEVLGSYADGRAAFVARDFGSHKSVYCTSTFMTTAMLRNILRYAGCHIYVEDDIYIDATHSMIMVTNTFKKERTVTVSLPRQCDVFELVHETPVASGVRSFEVSLPRSSTLLYQLQ
jgi:hypothetical protein